MGANKGEEEMDREEERRNDKLSEEVRLLMISRINEWILNEWMLIKTYKFLARLNR